MKSTIKFKFILLVSSVLFSITAFSSQTDECARPGKVNLVTVDHHQGGYLFKVNDDDGSISILKLITVDNSTKCSVVRPAAAVGSDEYKSAESLLVEIKNSAYGYRVNGTVAEDLFYKKIEGRESHR